MLFNGGALTPALIRDRLCDAAGEAGTARRPPSVLESASLDLAVARGAAYYGLVRRGLGVRIGGGSAARLLPRPGAGRADLPRATTVDALCLVARGMHEGEEVEITQPEFEVLANAPVSFPLFASSTRLGDAAGALVDAGARR